MNGKKITIIRNMRGYTQAYVAKRLRIAQTEYSKIETGQRKNLDDSLLSKLAEILSVSIEDIKSDIPLIILSYTEHSAGTILNHQPYPTDEQTVKLLMTIIEHQDKRMEKIEQLWKYYSKLIDN